MANEVKLTELNNAGIRAAATKADKAGNGNGKIDTKKEYELIFNYYEKTKPSDPKAHERMEDPTITADMDRLEAGYAILEYDEFQKEQGKNINAVLKGQDPISEYEQFQKEQNKNIETALKNTKTFKMPKTASEFLTQLKKLI